MRELPALSAARRQRADRAREAAAQGGEGYRMETNKSARQGRPAQRPGVREARLGRRRKDKAALVEKVIENLEKRLENDELKATVSDLIRLVQLEKELNEEQPKEIKVTWVEPEQGDD